MKKFAGLRVQTRFKYKIHKQTRTSRGELFVEGGRGGGCQRREGKKNFAHPNEHRYCGFFLFFCRTS